MCSRVNGSRHAVRQIDLTLCTPKTPKRTHQNKYCENINMKYENMITWREICWWLIASWHLTCLPKCNLSKDIYPFAGVPFVRIFYEQQRVRRYDSLGRWHGIQCVWIRHTVPTVRVQVTIERWTGTVNGSNDNKKNIENKTKRRKLQKCFARCKRASASTKYVDVEK